MLMQNNRTSLFLRSYSIFTILAVLIFTLGFATTTSAATLPSITPTSLSSNEQISLSLINSERAKTGAKPLQNDLTLNAIAEVRAKAMLASGRISHIIPVLGSHGTTLRMYNVSYKTASENLQYGARSPYEAHMYLMQSWSHRNNILNRNFTHVGIAIIPNGRGGQLQVQLFVGR